MALKRILKCHPFHPGDMIRLNNKRGKKENGIISQLLGQILVFIYENLSFGSYGLAIILFTVFIKLLLLPLSIKQYKSSLKMQEMQPLIQEIQRNTKMILKTKRGIDESLQGA